MNTQPLHRHHRYRHEERAYRRDVWTRRICILLSVGLLLGTAWLLYCAGEPAERRLPNAGIVAPHSLQAVRTPPPAGASGGDAPRLAR